MLYNILLMDQNLVKLEDIVKPFKCECNLILEFNDLNRRPHTDKTFNDMKIIHGKLLYVFHRSLANQIVDDSTFCKISKINRCIASMNVILDKLCGCKIRGGGKGKPTIILFYADWCGHCKSFKPTWSAFENIIDKSKINIVKTNDQAMCTKYKVNGYPTIRYYPNIDDIDIYEELGDRSIESLVNFVNDNVGSTVANLP